MIRRLVIVLGLLVVVAGMLTGGFLYWLLAGSGVRLALERQASAWLGQPVHIGTARARLFPQPGLHLEQIDVGDPVRLTLGTVDVSSDGAALLHRRIEHASIVVTSSRIAMPLPFSFPAGSAPGGGEHDGDSIDLVSVTSIDLKGVRISSRGRELAIDAESALAGSRLTLRNFSARSGDTALTAEGEIDLAPRVEARVRVKANRLDIDELVALASAFAPAGPPAGTAARREPMRLAARVSAENASMGGVDVRQFATDFELEGSRVSLSPLTFQLFGGRYEGSLSATLKDLIAVSLRSRITDLDVAQLAASGSSAGSITGRLTGAGTFSGSGKDFAAILGSVRGEGTASIVDGSIKHLDLVRTVVLFFGRPAPDAGPSSDRFKQLDATFAVANHVVSADALSLHSDDADLVGHGTLSLDSKALDGRVDMSLSEALSAQAGTDLARYTREGNRIVLPAVVGGTLDRPHITIDAAAAVQRGLRNELQRRLGGLLDRLKGGQTSPQP